MTETGPTANYAAIAARLAPTGAKLFLGEKYLLQNDAPNRIVWCWASADLRPPRGVGGNPRSRFDDHWLANVHCWGESFDRAYRLRQAVIRAVRDTMQGARFSLGRTEVISDREHEHFGHVLVLQVTLVSPLVDVNLDAPIADQVHLTARAKDAEVRAAAVLARGTSPPLVLVSGPFRAAPRVEVEIDGAGSLGAASFRYSVDGGVTWEATGVATATSIELAGTGLVVHFPEGHYSTDNVYTLNGASSASGDGYLDSEESEA